jgi:hypothetical protein
LGGRLGFGNSGTLPLWGAGGVARVKRAGSRAADPLSIALLYFGVDKFVLAPRRAIAHTTTAPAGAI